MKQRYPVISPHASPNRRDNEADGSWIGYDFLMQVCDLDLLYRPDTADYVISCDPEQRKPECWNVVQLQMRDGNLFFYDTDVEPDPYHMCLLYQAIQEHQKE